MDRYSKAISITATVLLLAAPMSQPGFAQVKMFNKQQCAVLLKLTSVCEKRARISYDTNNDGAGDRFTECANNYLSAYHDRCAEDAEAEFMNQVFSGDRSAANAGANAPLEYRKAREAERQRNSSSSESASGDSGFDVGQLVVGLTALAGIYYGVSQASRAQSRVSCGAGYFNHLGVCMPYGRGSPSYVPIDRPSGISR